MPVAMMKGRVPMEMKKVSISAKRQITIPQKFFTMLGFDTEAECIVRGNDLLERFKKAQEQVRPAVEAMLVDAERIAASESDYVSYNDVFDAE